MSDYFNYLKSWLIEFFQSFGNWFKMRYADPWGPVPGEFSAYHDLLTQWSPGFGVAGWIFFVVFALLGIAFLGGLLYLIYFFVRKYIKFYKTEVDKDHLRDEVEKLNIELYNTIQEKNRVLALQVDQLGLKKPEDVAAAANGEKTEQKPAEDDANVRFPRLIGVDRKYQNLDTNITLSGEKDISLEDLCKRFRLFCASQLGLYYTPETMRALFASMGTTKIIILEGISGTGK